VALLAEEHRQRVGRLTAMEAVASERGPLDDAEVERLTEAAAAYSSHLRSHILKEDRILLPLTEALLTEDRMERLAAGVAAFARSGDESGLVALAERLAERYPPLS